MALTPDDLKYLDRCNQLAINALGNTYPNPMVGAVIVHNQQIIGEGYHVAAGEPHAEINAIIQVKNKDLLKESTLYISLEPCNHQGKTPACTKAIVEYKIPRVVIDSVDPNPIVNHSGIEYLRKSGVEVEVKDKEVNRLENINKRFFTYQKEKRPYIILKWAKSVDNFIDGTEDSPVDISNEYTRQLSHKWRTEEQGILIGKNTFIKDNPKLNARLWKGNENYKFVIDRNLEFPVPNHLFEQKNVFVINEMKEGLSGNVIFVKLNFENDFLKQSMEFLFHLEIQSIIIEGGSKTLQSFIDQDLWDEARIFTNPNMLLGKGVSAPNILPKKVIDNSRIGDNQLQIVQNG